MTFSTGGKIYCGKTAGPGTALRGARVTLLHFQDGAMRVDYKGRTLACTHVRTRPGPRSAEDEKTLDARMSEIVAAAAKAKTEPLSPPGRG